MHPIGRIYKLISSNGLIYIGSTVGTLQTRLSQHKGNAKHNRCGISSKSLFEDNAIVSIELIEEYQNITIKALQELEYLLIGKTECVNIAGNILKKEARKAEAKAITQAKKDKKARRKAETLILIAEINAEIKEAKLKAKANGKIEIETKALTQAKKRILQLKKEARKAETLILIAEIDADLQARFDKKNSIINNTYNYNITTATINNDYTI
jgi:hypothetical protein